MTRLLLCALCAALYSGLCAQTLTVTVKNPADYARSNYPVTLSLADYPQTRSAVVCEHVLVGNRPELIQEIPSQVSSGEVIFVADVPAGGERTYTVELNSEQYGVGFRKGSDLADAFNSFWKEAYDAGTVMETATTYGVQESIIEK